MKIIDDATLTRFSLKTHCELCNRASRGKLDPHHAVYTRGHCRLDIACNLVSACRECHSGIDNAGGREKCIAIIAKREASLPIDVTEVCKFFRNLPKGLTKIQMTNRMMAEFNGVRMSPMRILAGKVIDAMPDQSPPPAKPLTKKKRRPSAKRTRAKLYRQQQRKAAKAWKEKHA